MHAELRRSVFTQNNVTCRNRVIAVDYEVVHVVMATFFLVFWLQHEWVSREVPSSEPLVGRSPRRSESASGANGDRLAAQRNGTGAFVGELRGRVFYFRVMHSGFLSLFQNRSS
jgi:hypothetical protein